MRIFLIIPFIFLVIFRYSTSHADDDFNIEKEISKLRTEFTSVKQHRKTVRDDILKDEKEFAVYTQRTKKRFESIQLEIDSIQWNIKVQKVINDSLDALANALKNSQHQVDLSQEHFRSLLIKYCDQFLKRLKYFSPMVSKLFSPSLAFLHTELSTKKVDNIEGTQRLIQIVRDIDEATTTIQIVQGASPVAEIRGTVYQIKLGAYVEAVVNTEGTAYALWRGYNNDGNPIWQKGNDSHIAEQLLKCVNVREGKSLPAFIEIPFTTYSEKEASE